MPLPTFEVAPPPAFLGELAPYSEVLHVKLGARRSLIVRGSTPSRSFNSRRTFTPLLTFVLAPASRFLGGAGALFGGSPCQIEGST